MDPETLFSELGGDMADSFPCIHSPSYTTTQETPYLRHAGVALIGRPNVRIDGLRGFLEGFDPSLGFSEYLNDPTELSPATLLLKTAGQTCYASFGEKRTYNENVDRYLANLVSSGHGSVFEHATFSFFVYGISRSNSHEVVRHRAGTAFSQLSQRFVSGRVLRFVERPEYQTVPELHDRFERRIDAAAQEYQAVTTELLTLQSAGDPRLEATARTDRRKRVQQVARSVIPNEAETTMVLSANVRAWRHMIEMRTHSHAESEIRDLYCRIFACLRLVEPKLFSDYQVTRNPDSTFSVSTQWPKV